MGAAAVTAGQALLNVLEKSTEPAALQWLQKGLVDGDRAFSRGLFFGFYAGSGRRFRLTRVSLEAADTRLLQEVGLPRPEAFAAADMARAALLLSAMARLPAEEHVGLATEAFRKGDNDERIGLLRCLSLFVEPERFVPIAVEACRTHVQDVFEAIACDNAFPADHFPDPNFNQLVVKALFTDVPLTRIHGWRRRNNQELARMAGDYAAERRAAGRSVPDGVAMIQSGAEP